MGSHQPVWVAEYEARACSTTPVGCGEGNVIRCSFCCDSVEYEPHHVFSSAHFDCNCLRARMKSSASRAAVMTPAALYKAATK